MFTYVRKNRIRWAIASISVMGLVSLGLLLKRPQSSAAYNQDCLGKPYFVLAESGRYQVIQEDPETYQGLPPRMLVVTVDGGVCSILNPLADDGHERPFRYYIDAAVAVQLWEKIYQGWIDEAGSLQAYNAALLAEDLAPGETVLIHIDNVQALNNLGVSIPDFYEAYARDLPPLDKLRDFYAD